MCVCVCASDGKLVVTDVELLYTGELLALREPVTSSGSDAGGGGCSLFVCDINTRKASRLGPVDVGGAAW